LAQRSNGKKKEGGKSQKDQRSCGVAPANKGWKSKGKLKVERKSKRGNK